ncbi:MAG: DUF465 domain-containing protein [Alphaproteobacteria bacterium]|nr:DUF465 domain-containing protein [Alphaproteobacteria bacterium]
MTQVAVSPADSHLEALETRHAFLSHRIETEQRHPAASDQIIRTLKRQKLRLKEEIEKEKGRLA